MKPFRDTLRRGEGPWLWIPTVYFAEGMPNALVATVSVMLYNDLGVSNEATAFFTSLLYLPWVIKPLWSPAVDLLKTRRQWIWTMQLLLGLGLAGIALAIPSAHFVPWTIVFFGLLAFSSATHDIAADGFYMLAPTEREQSFFIGFRSVFFNIGKIFAQGGLVFLAGHAGKSHPQCHRRLVNSFCARRRNFPVLEPLSPFYFAQTANGPAGKFWLVEQFPRGVFQNLRLILSKTKNRRVADLPAALPAGRGATRENHPDFPARSGAEGRVGVDALNKLA